MAAGEERADQVQFAWRMTTVRETMIAVAKKLP